MIESERLILRRWEERDRATFYAHCADSEVMHYLGLLTPEQVDEQLERHDRYFATLGYGFFSVERRTDGALLGFCGFKPGFDDTPAVDGVEIGWRLAKEYWGQGYAREAAQAALDWGWTNIDTDEVVALTAASNTASWRVMERLGMVRDPAADFEVAKDDPALRPHITYRINRSARAGR